MDTIPKSTVQNDYTWPHPLRFTVRACAPLLTSHFAGPKKVNRHTTCNCGVHLEEHYLKHYEELLKKRDGVCKEYTAVLQELSETCNELLNSGDLDETMQSIYKTDYKRKEYPLVKYKPLKIDEDCRLPSGPVPERLTNVKPHAFMPDKWPNVSPPEGVSFETVPSRVQKWCEDAPVRTEYEEKISAPGMAVWRASQAYKEPRPTARRRKNDRCV